MSGEPHAAAGVRLRLLAGLLALGAGFAACVVVLVLVHDVLG